MFPALAHVGAARAFANRVQIERAHRALQILKALATKNLTRSQSGRGCEFGAGTGIAGEFEMIWNGVPLAWARNPYFTRFSRLNQTGHFSS